MGISGKLLTIGGACECFGGIATIMLGYRLSGLLLALGGLFMILAGLATMRLEQDEKAEAESDAPPVKPAPKKEAPAEGEAAEAATEEGAAEAETTAEAAGQDKE